MPNLIGPDGLEPDAVVPQCLDNQYVTDAVFADMQQRGVDYQDPKIAAARERDFRSEFIRSLVYSSQVVIQRAFLKNSDFLYKNYLPTDQANLGAFAELIRQHAIVPYLFAESSLTDNLEFDVSKEGDAAARVLLGEVGDDVRCVRLATNDAANSSATTSLATDFGTGLVRLNNLSSGQRNAMASELFADPAVLQQDGKWRAFEDALDELADYAFTKSRERRRDGKTLTRQDVYQDCLAAGDDDASRNKNVVLGRFQPAGSAKPFQLELKKYIDLVYNTNLPDHLRRYTFTPAKMPTRIALQDMPGSDYGHSQIKALVSDRDGLEWLRRAFSSATQIAMNLPLLSELTVADALAVRSLPEWTSFKDAQATILLDPLHCLDNLPAFQQSFDHFQRALSDWFYRTHKKQEIQRRYCNFVSLTLSIGGLVVVAGSHLPSIPHDLAAAAVPTMVDKIPQKIKGYAAKLMVGVYDRERQRIDSDRTYTIELMQTNEELLRAEVVELLASITGHSEGALPGGTGIVADQAIR